MANLARAPEWRHDIEGMIPEFARTLPPQLPTQRFVRTVLTAIQVNPELAQADRHTLKVACMRAAQDSLLPDGREGALVVFNTKNRRPDGKDDVWIKSVQWMPMVAGLLKKARNSGEIASISAHVVYRHDKFRLVFGDDELLEHEPNLEVGEDALVQANAIGAYAVGRLKDGTVVRVWRSRGQIMTAKSQSRAQNSLMWTTFWEEGWIKTAIRYLTKYLPTSTDKDGVDSFVRAAERDDELSDFSTSDAARDVTPEPEPQPRSRMDDFVDNRAAARTARKPRAQTQPKPAPEPEPEPEPQPEPEPYPNGDELGEPSNLEEHDAGIEEDRGRDENDRQPELGLAEDEVDDADLVAETLGPDDRITVTWPGVTKPVEILVTNAIANFKARMRTREAGWREECLRINPVLARLLERPEFR